MPVRAFKPFPPGIYNLDIESDGFVVSIDGDLIVQGSIVANYMMALVDIVAKRVVEESVLQPCSSLMNLLVAHQKPS
jgi:hypothetical protein